MGALLFTGGEWDRGPALAAAPAARRDGGEGLLASGQPEAAAASVTGDSGSGPNKLTDLGMLGVEKLNGY